MLNRRLAALSDSKSAYYANVTALLRKAQADAELVASKRQRVVIPFKVDASVRAMLEGRFGWRIEVNDHGLTSQFSPTVAALAYCMALRNMLAGGRDGEEVIAVDVDVPSLVAKGASYVKVVRTSATNRLCASYAIEDSQLSRLVKSKVFQVRNEAELFQQQIAEGGGRRISLTARDSRLRADTVLFDHTRTSVSLAQAVECARRWGADTVRGVCFFQPEMLIESAGRLAAFAGEYVVDERTDLITYVPDEDPGTSFSHGWSALKSFFLNHECVVGNETWLVEKHLGCDGIFHYAARKACEPWEFPVELGANYYSDSLTEWVELEYPTRGRHASGARPGYWRRDKVRLPKSLYDKVIGVMMTVDVKHLTREEVLTLLRNHNNTVVVGGDTVKKPVRTYADDLVRASVPILAQVVYRRAAASVELSTVLGVLRKRYAWANEGFFTLVWSAMCEATDYMTTISVPLFSDGTVDAVDALVADGMDMSVLSREVPHNIEVRQVVGGMKKRDYGPFAPYLPSPYTSGITAILAKAKKAVFDMGLSYDPMSFVRAGSEPEEKFFDASEEMEPVAVVEQVRVVDPPKKAEALRRKLFDKLVAEQDAVNMGRPPVEVHRYEGVSRADVVLAPVIEVSNSAMQEDYDDFFPGVSMADPEIAPYVAAEADGVVHRDIEMSVNDSKRTLPKEKMIRRAKCRAGAAGMLPRCQAGLQAAVGKRNSFVPTNRGEVNFSQEPAKVVKTLQDVCYVDNWQEILHKELETGLWQPTKDDLEVYVTKVDTNKAEAMLKEFFSLQDVDMRRWLIMTKGKAKPPIDPGADTKVPLPQTIMYSESKTTNAMYSSIMSRFHDVVDKLTLPGIRFNSRSSPSEHELWFNSLQPVRKSCKRVYRYQGDSFNFDRSLELMAFSVELQYYRDHGLDERTLQHWKQTMGPKKAISLMHGLVLHIALQGLSGIFKTLFRNGLVTWAAVVDAAKLSRHSLISLDIKGDDYLLETSEPLDVAGTVQSLAWKYNFSAKFFSCENMYFCSKFWVLIDGWWYWVADPIRRFESLCAAITVSSGAEEQLSQKWRSLCDDLRHYDNQVVLDKLGEAVCEQYGVHKAPNSLIMGLGNMAANRDRFFSFYGPTEVVGL